MLIEIKGSSEFNSNFQTMRFTKQGFIDLLKTDPDHIIDVLNMWEKEIDTPSSGGTLSSGNTDTNLLTVASAIASST